MSDSKQKKITLPFCGVCFFIGLALGLLVSYHGHPKLGASLILIFFIMGFFIDLGFAVWGFYWTWTQECAWCSRRVHPLVRNRLLSDDLKHGKFWFCSPRCYTEWNRRHFAERKQINILNEGGPLISTGRDN